MFGLIFFLSFYRWENKVEWNDINNLVHIDLDQIGEGLIWIFKLKFKILKKIGRGTNLKKYI